MIINKKTALVLGAGGFIGGHLVKRLLKDEFQVVAAVVLGGVSLAGGMGCLLGIYWSGLLKMNLKIFLVSSQ